MTGQVAPTGGRPPRDDKLQLQPGISDKTQFRVFVLYRMFQTFDSSCVRARCMYARLYLWTLISQVYFAFTTVKVSFTLTVVAERDTPSPAPGLESEAMAAGTSTPPMSAGAPFTYGGYATTPTIHSPGTTTPTKVKTPPKYVKHARFLPDVENVLQDVEHYAAIEDNRGFIEAVKKAFRAMQN